MAYVTSTGIVGTEWTLVVTGIAMIQFNSRMFMAVTSGELPTESVGFLMESGEKYVNASGTASIYVCMASKTAGMSSVRILKDVV